MILWMTSNYPPEHGNALCRPLGIFTTRALAKAACTLPTHGIFPSLVDDCGPTPEEIAALNWRFCTCCNQPFVWFPLIEAYPGEKAPSNCQPCAPAQALPESVI